MADLFTRDEDNELLRRIAEGDERAFRAIFNRYHNLLGAHLRRITRSHELAQELVQDIFLKIWTNREQLPAVINFRGYLYVISKNHALNYLKDHALERTLNMALESSHDVEAEDFGEENDRYDLTDEAIDHLPPQQKQVYLMSRHDRLKYAEIATRLSPSRETVKKYLQISSESITNYVRKRLTISILFIFLLLN